jgi:hypothetical protein
MFQSDISPDVKDRTLGDLAYTRSVFALRVAGFHDSDPRIISAKRLYESGDVSGANNLLDGCFDSFTRTWVHDDPLENSTKKGGCIGDAFELLRKNNDEGEVFYVVDIDGTSLGHAYFVPSPSRLIDFAKNQADNGFEGYPRLTVAQVLKYGVRLKDDSAKELTKIIMTPHPKSR